MGDSDASRHGRLLHAVEHAAHLLPAQGPITVFIHHNTLHAFEDMPFDAGGQSGAKRFGCEPYLSEDQFRACLARRRITGEVPPGEGRSAFGQLLADAAADTTPPLPRGTGLRAAHPWFGPIDVFRWHCLLGVHQGIHRVQLERVRDGLAGR